MKFSEFRQVAPNAGYSGRLWPGGRLAGFGHSVANEGVEAAEGLGLLGW